MLAYEDKLPKIPLPETLTFAALSSLLWYLYRMTAEKKSSDLLFGALNMLVGKQERELNHQIKQPQSPVKAAQDMARSSPRVQTCPHAQSCLKYSLEVGIRILRWTT